MVTNRYMMAGAVVAGLALAYVVYKSGRAVVGAVGDVATAVNPFNNDNVINQGFTDVYQAVTGSTGSLGTDIYDVTHNGTLNPASTNNAVYGAANSAWNFVGILDDGETIGTKLYDWFN